MKDCPEEYLTKNSSKMHESFQRSLIRLEMIKSCDILRMITFIKCYSI